MKLSEVCRLQIQTGEPDSFVLDQTELNDGDFGIAGLEDFRLNVNAVLDEDQLDGGSFFFTNVLDDASSVSISRGMVIANGATPYAIAGSVSALVRNNEYDPFVTKQFKTGRTTRFQVLYDDEWHNVFQGKLRSVTSDYDVDGRTFVRFEATDLIDDLAQTQLKAVSFPAQNTGERMQALMQGQGYDIEFIDDTSAHSYDLAAQTITNNLLEECENINYQELGAFYINKDNQMVFLNYGQTSTPEIVNPIFTNNAINSANKVGMTDLEMSTGKELFFNKIVAKTDNDPDTYELTAATSKARHGEVAFFNSSLNLATAGGAGSGQTVVTEYMNRFLERWSDIPEKIDYTDPRRYAKTVFTINRPNDLRYPVLAEIGDAVKVDFDTDLINFNQDSMVLSIDHDIDPDRWLTKINLIPVPNN